MTALEIDVDGGTLDDGDDGSSAEGDCEGASEKNAMDETQDNE